MTDSVKTVFRWTFPTVVLLAVATAAYGIPSLPVGALLVLAGVSLSWSLPWLREKLNKVCK